MTAHVFQIGFNKCATTALNKLFHRSGVKALHGSGKYWRDHNHPALAGRNVQQLIHHNIAAGRKAIDTLEDFQGFFDMESVKDGSPIENFRHFRVIARDYPDSKFILNVRDKTDWLKSRIRHNDGAYMAMAMARTGRDAAGVVSLWSDDYDRHHDAVQNFFQSEADRLIVFDIDRTPIRQLVRFCKPQIVLWPRFWKPMRVTDLLADDRGWSEPAGISIAA